MGSLGSSRARGPTSAVEHHHFADREPTHCTGVDSDGGRAQPVHRHHFAGEDPRAGSVVGERMMYPLSTRTCRLSPPATVREVVIDDGTVAGRSSLLYFRCVLI